MKTPVIIPALNEERNIGRLLTALPADSVEPIVVVNGSSDRTAEIARSFGCMVFDLPEEGKLPAIQFALRELGQQALKPLILLDADTLPLYPKRWHSKMLQSLEPESNRPIVVGGPVWEISNPDKPESKFINRTIRSLYRIALANLRAKESSSTGFGGVQYGANLGCHIQNIDSLDRVINLDHYWPREDLAMTMAIVKNGGMYKQITNLDSLVLYPEPEALEPISSRFKYGLFGDNYRRGVRETHQAVIKNYIDRGAPGSKLFKIE